jgi:hypothetical protein
MKEGGQGGRDTTVGWEESRAGEKKGRREERTRRSGTRERTYKHA